MRSAMPQRRMCSQVRVLARLVVGKSTLPSVCSTTRQRMPRQANSMATARPTGPAPAMRTGYCFVDAESLIGLSSVSCRPLYTLPALHERERVRVVVNTRLGELSTRSSLLLDAESPVTYGDSKPMLDKRRGHDYRHSL